MMVRDRLFRSRLCGSNDLDVLDHDIGKRFVLRGVSVTARNASDGLHNLRIFALAKDRVATVEARIRGFRYKELRTVGVRSCIRVGESSGLVEAEVRAGFVLELVARVT